MLMKIFRKGQVVIPAEIRRNMGISVGDLLEVTVDAEHRSLRMKAHDASQSRSLAGSLAAYTRRKKFPLRRQMVDALKKGLSR